MEYLSFEVGKCLGRFHNPLSPSDEAPSSLTNGILFISPRGEADSIMAPQLESLASAWKLRGSADLSLRDWFREDFFDFHRSLYENRPIYFPLASAKKSFVAYISIHHWVDSTLSTLLADYLIPERKALEGAIVDLQSERNGQDKKTRASAEKRYVQYKRWLEELEEFITKVRQCAEKGPPRPDDKTEDREADAPYRMDLDDGVMVNSAALWPLLDPMWKDPKKWWKELANANGKKGYDWSHLAFRYFPSRVDEKCRQDPSLAVAHGCFWKYHPEKAYQWELRLKDEIGPDFKLDEKDSDSLRAAFLEMHAERARDLEAAELARRERKARKQAQEELDLPDAENEEEADEEAESE